MLVTSSLVAAGLVLIVAGYMFGLIVTNGGGEPLMLASFAIGVVLLGLARLRHLHRG